MAAKTGPVTRFALALLLGCVVILTAQTGLVHAEPNGDSIIYVVQSGDRLVDIATRYGVTAGALARTNGLADADTIFPGQRLVIPISNASTPTPGESTSNSGNAGQSELYIVRLGDTLATIARRSGVSVAALQRANNLSNPNVLWVGQKLVIPDTSPSATQTPEPTVPPTTVDPATAQPATASPTTAPAVRSKPPTAQPPAAPASEKIHIVKAGETLSQIARKYGVTVEALVLNNGLGSADLVRAGTRLVIPGKSSGDSVRPVPTVRVTKFVASISQQRCWLYSGKTVIARWRCSTGRRASGTRIGSFRVQSKMAKAYGSRWNIWMPFWLGIYWAGGSENGIHGLPWNAKTGAQIWSGSVGVPITFGCIMLDNANAKKLYDLAYVGMPIIVQP